MAEQQQSSSNDPVKGFDASVSITTAKRRAQEAQTELLHAKTFGAWANHQLSRKGYQKIEELTTDLRDGVKLIHLMEAIYDKKLDKKYNATPKTEIDKIENVALALELLKEHDSTLQINSKDIVDGNRKLILGMIWRLIMTRQMLGEEENTKMSVTQRNKQAKANLVNFVKRQTEGYEGVEINDLVESFYDGLAFCAVVDKMKPGALDWESMRKATPLDRLQTAFDVAERELGIPKLLDPQDMVNEDVALRPDEKCLMTYISEFPIALIHRREEDDKEKQRKLAEQLEKEKVIAKEKELQLVMEKEKGVEQVKLKESESDKIREENEKLRTQREELQRKAQARKEELRIQNEVAFEENKRLQEEINRLKEETAKVKSELDHTQKKMIGKIVVTVKEAKSLPAMDVGGKSDPYIKLKLENQEFKTKIKKKTLNPKWEQKFELFVTDRESELAFQVWSYNRFSADELMGKVYIAVSDLKDGQNEAKWYSLIPLEEGDKISGEIYLQIMFKLGK